MCPLCSLEVENEIHFLIYCNKYDFIREPVYQKSTYVFPEFIRLDELGRFVYLMSQEDDKITEQIVICWKRGNNCYMGNKLDIYP